MLTVDDRQVRERVARLDGLLVQIEAFHDPRARSTAAEALQSVLQLYGDGLARMMELVAEQQPALLDGFAADELVSHLLLLHGLHPLDVETRVAKALEDVRPYLQSHGGNVELLGIVDGVAHVRLQGSCSNCSASTYTLQHTIEEAIQQWAPDLDGVNADGPAAAPTRLPSGFVPLTSIRQRAS